MCGFLAEISFFDKGKYLNYQNRETFDFRGPDKFSSFNTEFGSIQFARLSINGIDSGEQPFYIKKGLVGFGNGEVFNYLDLREKLPSFAKFKNSGSDIQVALEYLTEYGLDQICDLEGQFSLVLLDEINLNVSLLRDRTGEKPLYFRLTEEGIVVGSMISSLLFTNLTNVIQKSSVDKWCRYGFLPSGDTFFEEIKEVLPGYIYSYKDFSIEANRYWSWPKRGSRKLDQEFVSDLDKIIDKVSNEFIVSEVPVIIALSSGLDSNFVHMELSKRVSRNIPTLTLGFKESEFDESKDLNFLNTTAARIHIDINFADLDHVPLVQHINKFMDSPISDPGLIAFSALCSAVPKDVKVILTGDGGDELLRGYSIFRFYYLSKFAMWLIHLLGPKLGRLLAGRILESQDSAYLGFKQKLLRLTIGSLQQPKDRFSVAISSTYLHSYFFSGTSCDKFAIESKYDLENFFQQQNLPQVYLQKADRASMSFGIETRAFFLQRRIIEHFMCLNSRQASKIKFKKQLAKRFHLGEVSRRKHGFGVPMVEFMRAQPEPIWNLEKQGLMEDFLHDIWSKRSLNPAYANLSWCYLVLNYRFEEWLRIAPGIEINDGG